MLTAFIRLTNLLQLLLGRNSEKTAVFKSSPVLNWENRADPVPNYIGGNMTMLGTIWIFSTQESWGCLTWLSLLKAYPLSFMKAAFTPFNFWMSGQTQLPLPVVIPNPRFNLIYIAQLENTQNSQSRGRFLFSARRKATKYLLILRKSKK